MPVEKRCRLNPSSCQAGAWLMHETIRLCGDFAFGAVVTNARWDPHWWHDSYYIVSATLIWFLRWILFKKSNPLSFFRCSDSCAQIERSFQVKKKVALSTCFLWIVLYLRVEHVFHNDTLPLLVQCSVIQCRRLRHVFDLRPVASRMVMPSCVGLSHEIGMYLMTWFVLKSCPRRPLLPVLNTLKTQSHTFLDCLFGMSWTNPIALSNHWRIGLVWMGGMFNEETTRPRHQPTLDSSISLTRYPRICCTLWKRRMKCGMGYCGLRILSVGAWSRALSHDLHRIMAI
jgi:hypothetical protein